MWVVAEAAVAAVEAAVSPAPMEGDQSVRPVSPAEHRSAGIAARETAMGRITAIDLNSAIIWWMIPNGAVRGLRENHPAMKGIDLSNAGDPRARCSWSRKRFSSGRMAIIFGRARQEPAATPSAPSIRRRESPSRNATARDDHGHSHDLSGE
jgi:hypothetical protein